MGEMMVGFAPLKDGLGTSTQVGMFLKHGRNNRTRTFRIRSIYRVIQDKRPIFFEVTVSVIYRKRVHMDMCLFLYSYPDRAV
jgi:hypothetical protein